MLTMSYVAAAYVIVKVVESSVTISRGFYHNWANYSTLGNNMWAVEIFILMGWLFWAFLMQLLATLLASDVWAQLEARHAEAAQTIGFETPLNWTIAIKTNALLLLVGLMMVVSGFSLGDITDELITWVSYYDDDTNSESTDKNDSSNRDPAGTAISYDVPMHIVTALYGWVALFAISLGSYIFAWSFLDVKDGGADFECEIKNYDYSAIAGIVANITDKESCLENVDALFDVADVNGDNYISRCEDVNFQVAQGQDVEFAKKFSTAFTRPYVRIVCDGQFRY